MAQKLIGGLAPRIVLAPGYVVRVTAISPTDGSTVSGVKVSDVTIQTDQLDQGEQPTLPNLMPLYVAGGNAA